MSGPIETDICVIGAGSADCLSRQVRYRWVRASC